MPEKKTVGDSGSCNETEGWCLYKWDEEDLQFYLVPNTGGCVGNNQCPPPNPNDFGGSEDLNSYDEFLVVVCCEPPNSGN